MSEVDQTLKRIEANASVIGTLVFDNDNTVIHDGFSDKESAEYQKHFPPLIERARNLVRDLDPTNDLTFIRIRSDKVEYMIAPGDDYTLFVAQNVVLIDA